MYKRQPAARVHLSLSSVTGGPLVHGRGVILVPVFSLSNAPAYPVCDGERSFFGFLSVSVAPLQALVGSLPWGMLLVYLHDFLRVDAAMGDVCALIAVRL